MSVALVKPYCSLPDVQDVCGVSDPDLDDKLSGAINSASRLVDEMTGRDFWFHDHASTAYQVRRASVISDLVLLPFEIITLTEVNVDDSLLDLEDLYYEVGRDSIQNQAPWGAYPFTGTILLKGTFGFALAATDPTISVPPTMPASITRATALIAAALSGEWKKERVSPDGSRESLLEVRIPAEAKALLLQWDVRKKLATF